MSNARGKPGLRHFRSHEEAEEAEVERRRRMTPEERLREFAALQARAWGEAWTSTPMDKTVYGVRRAPWLEEDE